MLELKLQQRATFTWNSHRRTKQNCYKFLNVTLRNYAFHSLIFHLQSSIVTSHWWRGIKFVCLTGQTVLIMRKCLFNFIGQINNRVKMSKRFNNSAVVSISFGNSWSIWNRCHVGNYSHADNETGWLKIFIVRPGRRRRKQRDEYELFNFHSEGTNERSAVNSIFLLFRLRCFESESHARPKFQMFTILVRSECHTSILLFNFAIPGTEISVFIQL